MEANYFTVLYWFCHTSTWIHHGCTHVPNPESPSHHPLHTIPLGHPSAPAPSILYPASNLDWQFISYMILYMFQCHSYLAFYSMQALSRLDEAHPRWGGQTTNSSTNSNGNQKSSHRHTQKRCSTNYLGTLWPSQVGTWNQSCLLATALVSQHSAFWLFVPRLFLP